MHSYHHHVLLIYVENMVNKNKTYLLTWLSPSTLVL